MGVWLKTGISKHIILLGLGAFFLSLFGGIWGCTEIKTYMAQREQDKALENLKKGVLEGQKYKNQLYECEILGPAGWKATLAYPEALVIYTKEDKITRIKLEVRELDREKKEVKDFIAEKEKTPTYKKIKEQRLQIGKSLALEVDFEGRWREEAKGDTISEKVIYFEAKKYLFILSFYTLEALWDKSEKAFNETLNTFAFTGEKTVEAPPPAPAPSPAPGAPATTTKPKETKPTPSPAAPPKPPACTPKYSGKVTAFSDNQISINLGSQQCIRKGMTGKVYYERIIAGAAKKIYIASFKVTSTSSQTSNAQIIESTDEVKTDHFIQIDKK